MSIYATILTIEDERQWIAALQADGIGAGVIREGEPTGDDLDAPIIYRGSHILPDEDHDARGGSVGLALIPSHITRDGRDERPEDGPPWPYLRLSVDAAEGSRGGAGSADVVLTRRQAARLRDAVDEWLSELARQNTSSTTPEEER